MHKYKEKNGYIALVSLIIIGAVVLLAVIGITFISLNQKNTLLSRNITMKNYYLANACANYALVELQKDPAYAGNESINIDDHSCQVETILGEGNIDRTIIASSQIGSQLKKIKVQISQLKPNTIIDSWAETF